MVKGTFHYETFMSRPLEEVWDFFSTAENLAKISSFPKVTILSNPKTIQGNNIEMKLNFLFFQKKWHAEITEVKEKSYFIDKGTLLSYPFTAWEHSHAFEVRNDGTLMKDTVIFSASLPAPIVRLFLRQMFRGRKKELNRYFH